MIRHVVNFEMDALMLILLDDIANSGANMSLTVYASLKCTSAMVEYGAVSFELDEIM